MVSLNGPIIGFAYSPGGALIDAIKIIVNSCPCSKITSLTFTPADINIELTIPKTVTANLSHNLSTWPNILCTISLSSTDTDFLNISGYVMIVYTKDTAKNA